MPEIEENQESCWIVTSSYWVLVVLLLFRMAVYVQPKF
jgi:hypothetical protein